MNFSSDNFQFIDSSSWSLIDYILKKIRGIFFVTSFTSPLNNDDKVKYGSAVGGVNAGHDDDVCSEAMSGISGSLGYSVGNSVGETVATESSIGQHTSVGPPILSFIQVRSVRINIINLLQLTTVSSITATLR